MAIDQEVSRVKVVKHVRCIKNRATRVEPRHGWQTALPENCSETFVFHGVIGKFGTERLGDLHRLRNTTRLNKQVVDVLVLRQHRDVLEQICTQRAANTTVRQLHEVLVALDQLATGNELCVNVELAHVIHNDSNAQPMVWT